MKLYAINVSLQKQKKYTFCGTPQRLNYGAIRNYQDALSAWENLRYAKYLDVHDDKIIPFNKRIRQDNYSFLDKLTSYFDKSEFINKYCDYTGFPNLAEVSRKICFTFENCIKNITYDIGGYNQDAYKVVDFGYDPTCSIGLNKALPGSDLDKGYVIINGDSDYSNEKIFTEKFCGKMWNNLDQRIVSLNHPNTFPSVYTVKQIRTMLDYLDKKSSELLNKEKLQNALLIMGILGTFGIMGGNILLALAKKYASNSSSTDPYEAAKFNRDIARKIPYSSDREDAKNCAFFIETVRANYKRNPYKYDSIFNRIQDSPFAQNSNVTQIEGWQEKINGGYMKQKLRNRTQLEQDFWSMELNQKYELIKDIIKYSSNDQSDKFSQYYKNDDDIDARYKHLLESLR